MLHFIVFNTRITFHSTCPRDGTVKFICVYLMGCSSIPLNKKSVKPCYDHSCVTFVGMFVDRADSGFHSSGGEHSGYRNILSKLEH